jgi:hypothetical protein
MTKISLISQVALSDDVLFQELQGDAVLLDLKTGVYFGLDRVGTRMWQLISEHKMLSAVVETVTGEFEVTEEKCADDLLSFVGRLQDQGLLSVE